MQDIRHADRICDDTAEIETFLDEASTGVLGLSDDRYPYAVPLNFIWYDGSVYVHGAGSGKRVSLLDRDTKGTPVCFTVYYQRGIMVDPVPCHADTAYMSVMIFGQAEKVTDYAESAQVMGEFLKKYMPGFYRSGPSPALMENYRSDIDAMPTSLYRITPDHLSAKKSAADESELFRHEDA